MARKKAPKKRRASDNYPTPHWCIDILAKRLERSLPRPGVVVDLGAGDGRIGLGVQRAYKGRPHILFLDLQRDPKFSPANEAYLEEDVPPWFDRGGPHEQINDDERVLYVSNPPFSLSHEFVWRAVSFVKGSHAPGSAAAFLLRADWWIGGSWTNPERSQWINENPPDAVIGLTPRPSFVGGGTDSREYAWHVWMHGAHHGTQMEVARRK